MKKRRAKSVASKELTPVDDVAAVREQFDREAKGDVATLVAQSRLKAATLRRQLGVRSVTTTTRRPGRSTKHRAR